MLYARIHGLHMPTIRPQLQYMTAIYCLRNSNKQCISLYVVIT